jgi:hypothetical protein
MSGLAVVMENLEQLEKVDSSDQLATDMVAHWELVVGDHDAATMDRTRVEGHIQLVYNALLRCHGLKNLEMLQGLADIEDHVSVFYLASSVVRRSSLERC